jgi:hypothetical protein
MLRNLTALKFTLPLVAVVLLGGAQRGPAAAGPDSEVLESVEARTALNALIKENGILEQKLTDAEESKAGLQKNLAIATGETEILKRQAVELRLRLEAFGLQGQGSDAGVEQRLLKAVGALRAAEQQKTALAASVIALSDCLEKLQANGGTISAETKAMLESAVSQGKRALDSVQGEEAANQSVTVATAASNEGKVIATKDDLALVVTSLGREGGVKVGMPFQVLRGDKEIGIIRIVDVRDRISGAVVQELTADAEKICVGDKLKIGAVGRM